LAWIRQRQACDYIGALEVSEAHAGEARKFADRVIVGDAERSIDNAFDAESFDLVLCLDVLEHMVDPWRFVSKLFRLMSPGATIVFSIPNVRNLRVVLPLLFLGQWTYEDEGILDRTHLRFFTRRTALEIASTPPLVVDRIVGNVPPPPSRLGLMNLLSCGLMKDFLAVQFLVASRLETTTRSRHPADVATRA
jgi:SAM-dependent methyltransferase